VLHVKVVSLIDMDSDDDDLIEVPEEVDEVTFFKSRLGMTGKRGDISPNLEQPSTSNPLLQSAPVLDFGLDLKYWENPEELTVPEILPNDLSSFVPTKEICFSANSVRYSFITYCASIWEKTQCM